MANLTPNSSFSLSIRFEVPNRPAMLASVVQAISSLGGSIGQIDLVEQTRDLSLRNIVVDAASSDHADAIVHSIKSLPDVKVLAADDRTFALHQGGKITVQSKVPLSRQSDLAMAYTPGVGRVCMAIAQDPDRVYELTVKGNMVAIVTDGSAVLGFGQLWGPKPPCL